MIVMIRRCRATLAISEPCPAADPAVDEAHFLSGAVVKLGSAGGWVGSKAVLKAAPLASGISHLNTAEHQVFLCICLCSGGGGDGDGGRHERDLGAR